MGKFSRIEVSFELSVLHHQALSDLREDEDDDEHENEFSVKNDRLVAVTENTMIEMPANCAR
jgi:hypothetical protein